tara:strand:+ start:89 stop:316 length:228 start_codon:yes stop_codon:yes gene_type:complete
VTKTAAKWWLVVAGFVIPILYVLSPGPVMRMMGSGSGGSMIERFLQRFYFPLEWLYNHIEWVENFYDWWFGVLEP